MKFITTPGSVSGHEVDLREYLGILLRRRTTVLLVLGLVQATALFMSLSVVPVYKATTTLQIEPDAPKLLNFEDFLQADATNDAFYQTQYRLIESRSLAQRVVEREALVDVPEFGGGAPRERPGPISRAIGWVTSLPLRALSNLRSPPNDGADVTLDAGIYSHEPDEDPELANAIDTILGGLEVIPVRNTRLVEVSWQSTNPRLAAAVTNAIADAFIAINLEAKFETAEQASQFLAGEIERLRDEIATGEAELQRYGSQRDILSSDNRQDTVTQALARLTEEYTNAQTDRVAKQAYYEQLRTSEPESVPEVFTNSLVLDLKTNLASLQQQYTEMSRRFTDDWPDMQRLRAQTTSQEQRIVDEARRIFDGMVSTAQSAFQTALDREQQINILLEGQKDEAIQLNRNLVAYRDLQVQIDNNKSLLDSLVGRQSETGVSARLQGMRTSNIRVIDPAIVPGGPWKPDVRQNMFLALLMGAAMGVGLAFVLEYLDNTLNSAGDVELKLGLPQLGTIPCLSNLQKGNLDSYAGYAYASSYLDKSQIHLPSGTSPELVNIEHPRSLLAEAYRSLRTAVLLSNPNNPPKTIVVTSAGAGEGKTTSAMNLAASLAQVNKKVLIVDADLRRPRLHRILNLDNDKGFVHYLTGAASQLRDVVQRTEVENLWALVSGPTPPNPAELLGAQRTVATLEALANAFDFVVIDTPPVMPVVDALSLVPNVDGVVVVVKGGETPYQVVASACRKIHDVHGHLLGIVLNSVTMDGGDYYKGGVHASAYFQAAGADSEAADVSSPSSGKPRAEKAQTHA